MGFIEVPASLFAAFVRMVALQQLQKIHSPLME
jgi:hypothetical protein